MPGNPERIKRETRTRQWRNTPQRRQREHTLTNATPNKKHHCLCITDYLAKFITTEKTSNYSNNSKNIMNSSSADSSRGGGGISSPDNPSPHETSAQHHSTGAVSNNAASAANTGVATMTITETQTQPATEEVLRLTLRARPSVTWDEGVIDNEGLGRKSSKRCCIFHKQRAFGESSTDSSDASDSDGSSSSGGPSNHDSKKPIATKKKQGSVQKKKKIPDYQRFHA